MHAAVYRTPAPSTTPAHGHSRTRSERAGCVGNVLRQHVQAQCAHAVHRTLILLVPRAKGPRRHPVTCTGAACTGAACTGAACTAQHARRSMHGAACTGAACTGAACTAQHARRSMHGAACTGAACTGAACTAQHALAHTHTVLT